MSRCQPFRGISTEIISEMTFKTVVFKFLVYWNQENLVKYVDFWIQILDIQARKSGFLSAPPALFWSLWPSENTLRKAVLWAHCPAQWTNALHLAVAAEELLNYWWFPLPESICFGGYSFICSIHIMFYKNTSRFPSKLEIGEKTGLIALTNSDQFSSLTNKWFFLWHEREKEWGKELIIDSFSSVQSLSPDSLSISWIAAR